MSRMRFVVGIDLSLTSTGVGIITQLHDGATKATAATVKSTGKRDASLRERNDRIVELIKGVVYHAGMAELAVIEGLFGGATAGSMLDRSGAWWFVVDALHRRNVPVAVLAPTSIKKAITDNGKADKAVMASHVGKLWPELEVANEDEADAIGMAHLGAVALGWDVKTLERHKEIKWQNWPTT